MPWDWSYYSQKLKDRKFSINDEMLRPYFELSKVKEGVFGLASRLYDITFKKNPGIPVYHKDVEAYEVFDKDGTYLAVLYTDFHPRAGKRSGAWMTSYKGQWTDEKSGENSRPHVSIVMNFTKPTQNKPALLTFDEVETFLHEFGHSLHEIFANSTYESLSGTNVYWDFVELPSQFMETLPLKRVPAHLCPPLPNRRTHPRRTGAAHCRFIEFQRGLCLPASSKFRIAGYGMVYTQYPFRRGC